MKLFSAIIFFVFTLLAGCGSETSTPKFPEVRSLPAHRSEVQITIRKGDAEWKQERGLEYAPGGFRLSAPITLPVDDPEGIILSVGSHRLAKLSWNAKMRESYSIPFANNNLQLAFRARPEPLQLEWVKNQAPASLDQNKIFVGAIRVKNNAKYPMQFRYLESGQARVLQTITNWRMVGPDPCHYSSESNSRELSFNVSVRLQTKSGPLLPQEERMISVFLEGEGARSLADWRLPVHAPAYQRNYLYLGTLKDFNRGLPPGGVIVCVPDRTVVSKLYNFPTGEERRPPMLRFSPKLQEFQTAYVDDAAIANVQLIPDLRNFLTFSN